MLVGWVAVVVVVFPGTVVVMSTAGICVSGVGRGREQKQHGRAEEKQNYHAEPSKHIKHHTAIKLRGECYDRKRRPDVFGNCT